MAKLYASVFAIYMMECNGKCNSNEHNNQTVELLIIPWQWQQHEEQLAPMGERWFICFLRTVIEKKLQVQIGRDLNNHDGNDDITEENYDSNAEGNHDDSGDDDCGDKEGLDKLREKGGQAVPTVQRVQFRSSDKYIYIEDDEIKIYVWT